MTTRWRTLIGAAMLIIFVVVSGWAFDWFYDRKDFRFYAVSMLAGFGFTAWVIAALGLIYRR